MRISRIAAPIALAACAGLAVTACGSSSSASKTRSSSAQSGSSAPASGKQIVLGWANPQAKQPIFATFTQDLDAAAAKQNIKVITLDGQASPSVQDSDIETFINDKVDAIVVFPEDAVAESNVLNKAAAAGIKIIGLNAILPAQPGDVPTVSAPYVANLDWGYVDGAAEEGKFVAQQLKGKGNVIGIKIPVPVPSLDAMLKAYQDSVTAGNPGITWLGTIPDATDDLAGARSAMADAITRYHGKIDGVLSYDDNAAEGAYQALNAAGIHNVVIVGQQGTQDAINAIKAGQMSGTIDTQPYLAAVWTLKYVRQIVNGQPFAKFLRLPIQLITKSNLDKYVSWSQGLQDIQSGKTNLNPSLPTS